MPSIEERLENISRNLELASLELKTLMEESNYQRKQTDKFNRIFRVAMLEYLRDTDNNGNEEDEAAN